MKQETKKALDELTRDIAEQAAIVLSRQLDHDEAKSKAEAARRVESAEMNKLNHAQQHMDHLIAKLRDLSPSYSNWKRPTPVSVGESE